VVAAALADEATAELIVVVDGSGLESLGWLEALERSETRVHAVAITSAGGVGDGARGSGVELAHEDLVVFLDDDVVPEPGLVSGHAAWHEPGTRRIVMGYMPIPPGPIRCPDDLPPFLYQEGYEDSCQAYESDPASILTGFWAGNFSMRRDDALDIGLSDSAYRGLQHGDRDFGLRCRLAGVEPVFDRSLRACHHYRRSYADFAEESRRWGSSRLQIHLRHEEVVGGLSLEAYEEGLGRVAKRLLRLTRRPRARRLSRVALPRAAAFALAAGRRGLAVRIAKLTRSVEQQYGTLASADAVRTPTSTDTRLRRAARADD
jgi:GT2 family glycosyltransferase